MDFKPSYLEIEPDELVRHLLRETGQEARDAVNPADLLAYLKLQHVSFSFETGLPSEVFREGARPRALLSFPDRLVATDSALMDKRARFSVLHEIGHYVLPAHEHALYLCDERGLNLQTRLDFEREANEFAAQLLFQGDRFTLEANSLPIAVKTVKALADKYQASYEATARRLVEQNVRPCMLIAFKEDDAEAKINTDLPPSWSTHYCIASARFRTGFFASVHARVPVEIATQLTLPGRDIAEGIRRELALQNPRGEPQQFTVEFFSNTYNIFCLLVPVAK